MLDNVTVIDETTENRADFFPSTQEETGFARSTMSHDSARNGNPSSPVRNPFHVRSSPLRYVNMIHKWSK